ncbi:hypothetical protein [Janthinobacterium sp. FW305-128]|uniref:hypothetical protein n=1 Tax=Janthinobacterium sp. FW305-128 TaxID=2775055 RepID=UPI001E55D65E|nr:hypothetical protein [Janthinobacterium sp. FW305-128]MCC7684742.1 hypothetical protein [Janthinobacterium sp. FW305-128]
MNTTPQQLAGKPAGDDQVARAREIVGSNQELQNRIDTFLAAGATRGQMTDFLSSLRSAVAEEQLKKKINTICRLVGIDQPSSADRLMAMQIGLMQEQNSILQNGMVRTLNQMRSDAQSQNSDSMFTALLGGALVGAVLTS